MSRNILALLALLPALLPAQQGFSFLQFSDPQFGMYTENRDFVQETANFEFAIATANRLKPPFVVVTGDLTNNHTADQIGEYHRIAARLDKSIKLYSVAGNHDVGNEPNPELLAAYRQKYGPDYYTFRQGPDFEGIILNSSLIQHPDKAGDEAAKQEAWLVKELSAAQQAGIKHIVVFQHIPFFLEKGDEPDQYFNIPRATREHYLAIFNKYGVREIFAGHYHRNADGRAGDIHMTTTGPVGKPIGPDPSGMRIIRVGPTGISSEYVGFGSLPNDLNPAPATSK